MYVYTLYVICAHRGHQGMNIPAKKVTPLFLANPPPSKDVIVQASPPLAPTTLFIRKVLVSPPPPLFLYKILFYEAYCQIS